MLMLILDMLYFSLKKGIVSIWKSEELYMVFMKIAIEYKRVLGLLVYSFWISDITSDK